MHFFRWFFLAILPTGRGLSSKSLVAFSKMQHNKTLIVSTNTKITIFHIVDYQA